MQANAAMERHMLEEQLEHARKDLLALRRKHDVLQAGGVLNPALLRAAQALHWLSCAYHATIRCTQQNGC